MPTAGISQRSLCWALPFLSLGLFGRLDQTKASDLLGCFEGTVAKTQICLWFVSLGQTEPGLAQFSFPQRPEARAHRPPGKCLLVHSEALQYYVFCEACPRPTAPVPTFIMAPVIGQEGGGLHSCLPWGVWELL